MVPSSADAADEDERREHGTELEHDAGGDDAAEHVGGNGSRELVAALL